MELQSWDMELFSIAQKELGKPSSWVHEIQDSPAVRWLAVLKNADSCHSCVKYYPTLSQVILRRNHGKAWETPCEMLRKICGGKPFSKTSLKNCDFLIRPRDMLWRVWSLTDYQFPLDSQEICNGFTEQQDPLFFDQTQAANFVVEKRHRDRGQWDGSDGQTPMAILHVPRALDGSRENWELGVPPILGTPSAWCYRNMVMMFVNFWVRKQSILLSPSFLGQD